MRVRLPKYLLIHKRLLFLLLRHYWPWRPFILLTPPTSKNFLQRTCTRASGITYNTSSTASGNGGKESICLRFSRGRSGNEVIGPCKKATLCWCATKPFTEMTGRWVLPNRHSSVMTLLCASWETCWCWQEPLRASCHWSCSSCSEGMTVKIDFFIVHHRLNKYNWCLQ